MRDRLIERAAKRIQEAAEQRRTRLTGKDLAEVAMVDVLPVVEAIFRWVYADARAKERFRTSGSHDGRLKAAEARGDAAHARRVLEDNMRDLYRVIRAPAP